MGKIYEHAKLQLSSITKQASYEALKCVANKACFYRSPQRLAFLTFTERPAIGAKRCGLERNSVKQNGSFLRSLSFELWALEAVLAVKYAFFDRAYHRT